MTTKADSNATSTIAVRPLNGLSANITLSITSISPGTGLSCTLSKTITRDASGDTILSCKGLSGAYTVLVTGTLRSSSHTTKVDYSIVSNAVTRPSNVLTYWPLMIVAAVGTVVAGIILTARKRP
ncbi:MAG TPA: hypothetical protein VFE98_08350 [Candidatus Bathyarchaeia archaeon]|nr:hypothetical protein [Candidatus Bathyarchaeia archaeon]